MLRDYWCSPKEGIGWRNTRLAGGLALLVVRAVLASGQTCQVQGTRSGGSIRSGGTRSGGWGHGAPGLGGWWFWAQVRLHWIKNDQEAPVQGTRSEGTRSWAPDQEDGAMGHQVSEGRGSGHRSSCIGSKTTKRHQSRALGERAPGQGAPGQWKQAVGNNWVGGGGYRGGCQESNQSAVWVGGST